MNLSETLQQHFNYPPLQKIDPNTQEVSDKPVSGHYEFGQAAIPAMLTGIYKLTRTDEGVESIVRGENSSNWVKKIFGDSSGQVIQRIIEYAGGDKNETEKKLNSIGSKAIELIKDATAPDHNVLKVKELMAGQRIHLLPYLPAMLQIGELLNDTTVDDRTNKMEGPISSLMQAVGSGFSSADKDEKTEN